MVYNSVYSASKRTTDYVSRSVAKEENKNVAVLRQCPVIVASNMTKLQPNIFVMSGPGASLQALSLLTNGYTYSFDCFAHEMVASLIKSSADNILCNNQSNLIWTYLHKGGVKFHKTGSHFAAMNPFLSPDDI